MDREKRGLGFYVLAAFFTLFVLFLYGPLSAIFILSFQGPNGGLTFPLNGVSVHWFFNLFEKQAVGDFGASFTRSLLLGLMVMSTTVVVALLAGLAFRRKFVGASPLFYLTIARRYAVAWSGTDALAGVDRYHVDFRSAGGAWSRWLTDTWQSSSLFLPPAQNVTYEFRSVAVDKAGNVEATTDRADVSTAGAIQLNQSTFYPIVPR